MTTIAALRTGSTITMASDHLVTTDQRMPFIRFPKIVRIEEWIVGLAGPVSLAQAAFRVLGNTLGVARSVEALEDVLRNLHAALPERAGLRPHHDAGAAEEMHIQLMLGGPLGLFFCAEDRALLEIADGQHWAIGSGAKYALGAMAMSGVDQGGLGPADRAKHAVLSAARYDLGTGLDVSVEAVLISHQTTVKPR